MGAYASEGVVYLCALICSKLDMYRLTLRVSYRSNSHASISSNRNIRMHFPSRGDEVQARQVRAQESNGLDLT